MIALLLPAFAGTTGSVEGILKDLAGIPVQGAKVTFTDLAKGKIVSATSNRKGSYEFPVIFPGSYKLHVEAKGFTPQDRSPVVIHVDSALRIDLTLEAGTNP
ncbi:MAG TPA: carboxypeptidase-like regulatory domain-containing protein [Bryobacteraceae bacterium]